MTRGEFIRASGVGALLASLPLGTRAEVLRPVPKAVLSAQRAGLDGLRELGPTITNYSLMRKRNPPKKMAAFYIDDVIFVFRDLAREKPKSCWDHRFLGHLREAHERYGLKVQLNIFYKDCFYYGVRAAAFSLKDMPDAWKDEFQSAKDWLKFGFHSYEEYPDYPWLNASYEDVKTCWELLTGEVERFAGPGMFAKAVTPHWGPMSKEGCVALRDCGVRVLWTSRGRRWEYDGNRGILPYGHGVRIENQRKPETAVYWRGGLDGAISVSACGYNHLDADLVARTRGKFNWVRDHDTGVNFRVFSMGGTCLNLLKLGDIPAAFEKNGEPEFYCHATHEEYFYRDYFGYQPDYCEKTFAAVKWMTDHGYAYGFIEDSVDA